MVHALYTSVPDVCEPHTRGGGGGEVLSYMGYIGTCCGIGYGF